MTANRSGTKGRSRSQACRTRRGRVCTALRPEASIHGRKLNAVMNESTTPQVAGEAQIPWAPLAGVMATVAIFAVAQGLTYPLLSFILERQGASAGMIGLSAAMTPLGLIAGSTLIPGLIRRLGSGFLGLGCAITAG